jgi:two-component system heavy metal sensor histidine kinase CusS
MLFAKTGNPWSLAARLTAGFAGAAFFLVLIATGVLDWALRAQFSREQDEILSDKAKVLKALIAKSSTDDSLRNEVEWEWEVTRRSRVAMRVCDDAGRTLVETPGMSERLPADQFAAVTPSGELVTGRDGVPYRIIRDAASTARAEPRILHLGLDRSDDFELLAKFRRSLLIVLALAPAACALLGYRVARRGLRPLTDVSSTATRISAANLSERLASAQMPAELAELARTFNAMLDRLEESFERITRFSADIAHELRTPLQVLRGEAEIALRRARSLDEYRQVLGSGLEEYGRLAKLIDSLLFLARADNPEMSIARERLDLRHELSAAVSFYEPLAAEKGVSLSSEVAEGTFAKLDRTLLQRALGNLVANAIAHTPSGGTVVARAHRFDSRIVMEVQDTGAGIAAEHLPHVFDRFYRADAARTTSAGRTGLGLALVKSIAELHNGTVEIESQIDAGTKIRLVIPD